MNKNLLLIPAMALTSLIATAGCSGQAKDPAPTVTAASPAQAPAAEPVAVAAPAPADPFAEISAVLTKTTKDQTAALAAPQQNLERALNARIEAWKATGATSTSKAEENLALARTDFAQKISALSTADDATWKNAKGEAMASLESLEHAFQEYLAGPVKN